MAQQAPGEHDLQKLVASMDASLHEETFVWVTIPSSNELLTLVPLQMTFREREGQTIITTKAAAEEQGLKYTFPSRMITLNVQSSLEAVGFMAAITDRLKQLEVGINPVSAYYHDHLFVPVGKENHVLDALQDMALKAKATQ